MSLKHNTAKKQRGIEELARFFNFEQFRPVLRKHCQGEKKINAGRLSYDHVKMFKIIILQACYKLSDDEMEFQLNDRISFIRICSIAFYNNIPDATTIWRFKESLGADGSRELFEIFERQMVAAGLQFSAGSIIDASFIEAPKQRNTPEENASIKETGQAPDDWSEAKKRLKDVDARWAKKGNETHSGYKHHAIVDVETKIITNQKTSPANVNDIEPMLDLMQENTKVLFADSAYLGKEKRSQACTKTHNITCCQETRQRAREAKRPRQNLQSPSRQNTLPCRTRVWK